MTERSVGLSAIERSRAVLRYQEHCRDGIDPELGEESGLRLPHELRESGFADPCDQLVPRRATRRTGVRGEEVGAGCETGRRQEPQWFSRPVSKDQCRCPRND